MPFVEGVGSCSCVGCPRQSLWEQLWQILIPFLRSFEYILFLVLILWVTAGRCAVRPQRHSLFVIQWNHIIPINQPLFHITITFTCSSKSLKQYYSRHSKMVSLLLMVDARGSPWIIQFRWWQARSGAFVSEQIQTQKFLVLTCLPFPFVWHTRKRQYLFWNCDLFLWLEIRGWFMVQLNQVCICLVLIKDQKRLFLVMDKTMRV